MEITDVRIRRVPDCGKLKAVASITIDHDFVVHDIKVIEGVRGLFISMPSKKTSHSGFVDVAHPINTETRRQIESAILEEYERVSAGTDAEEEE